MISLACFSLLQSAVPLNFHQRSSQLQSPSQLRSPHFLAMSPLASSRRLPALPASSSTRSLFPGEANPGHEPRPGFCGHCSPRLFKPDAATALAPALAPLVLALALSSVPVFLCSDLE